MPMNVPHLDYFRRLGLDDAPEFGARLYEALRSVKTQSTTMEQQTNSNMNGEPQPPPAISALRVSAGAGIFHLSVDHPGDFYRGARYHAEYATDESFTNPFPISMHTAREWRGNLGQMALHFRGSVSYGSSPPGPWVYARGGPFNGAASGEPPLPERSQGSGTGFPGQGLSGPGPVPFRSATGKPPTR